MRKLMWVLGGVLAIVSSVGVWAYAQTQRADCCGSIVCPLTGEEIPDCCCPLNR